MDSQKNNSLKEIVEAAKDEKDGAFKDIFEQLSNKVFAYTLSRTATREDALDITQETFVDLWKALDRFKYRSDEEFYGFVFTIARRKIATYYKKRKVELPLKEEVLPGGYEMKINEFEYLSRYVEKIGKKYSDVLRLRYWGDLKFKEIAKVLNISLSAAKVRHHRAIKELEAIIQSNEK